MSRCSHRDCVDEGYVTVEFAGGQSRDFCEFHAQHVAALERAEVAL